MKLKEIKPNSGEYYCGVGNKGYIFNSSNNFLTVLHVHNGILQRDFYNYIDRFPDKLSDLDWKPNFKHITFDENQGDEVIPVFYTEETYKSCWYCIFFVGIVGLVNIMKNSLKLKAKCTKDALTGNQE